MICLAVLRLLGPTIELIILYVSLLISLVLSCFVLIFLLLLGGLLLLLMIPVNSGVIHHFLSWIGLQVVGTHL